MMTMISTNESVPVTVGYGNFIQNNYSIGGVNMGK